MRLTEAVIDGIELHAPLVGLDDHPHLLEPLLHLDSNGPDRGIHTVGTEGLRRPDDPMVASPEHRDERIGHTQIGVLTNPDHGEQLAVGAHYFAGPVHVEVVAVVEIAVGRADVAHGLRDLVNRVVVEWGEHVHSSVGLGSWARLDTGTTEVASGAYRGSAG